MTQHSLADVVVVAAGSSRRMGGGDKLEMTIGGRPILRRTIEALASAPATDRIIVVTAAERVAELRATPWLTDRGTTVIPGGRRR